MSASDIDLNHSKRPVCVGPGGTEMVPKNITRTVLPKFSPTGTMAAAVNKLPDDTWATNTKQYNSFQGIDAGTPEINVYRSITPVDMPGLSTDESESGSGSLDIRSLDVSRDTQNDTWCSFEGDQSWANLSFDNTVPDFTNRLFSFDTHVNDDYTLPGGDGCLKVPKPDPEPLSNFKPDDKPSSLHDQPARLVTESYDKNIRPPTPGKDMVYHIASPDFPATAEISADLSEGSTQIGPPLQKSTLDSTLVCISSATKSKAESSRYVSPLSKGEPALLSRILIFSLPISLRVDNID